MNDNKTAAGETQEYRLSFKVRLISEASLGSGLGIGARVDSALARDGSGVPVLWWPAVKALLRDAADTYRCALAKFRPAELEDFDDQLLRLLGREDRGDQGVLVGTAWRFKHDDLPEPSMLITRTSRPVHSRAARGKTLRTIEVVRAGSKASGEVRLIGTNRDNELISKLLQRIEAVGSSKTRGSGRIQIPEINSVVQPVQFDAVQHAAMLDSANTLPQAAEDQPTIQTSTSNQSSQAPSKLQVVLRNVEPLLLVDGANSQNLMVTKKFIGGAAWRAALLNTMQRLIELAELTPSDREAFTSLLEAFAGTCRFTNAYPLPDDIGAETKALEVMPAPLTMQAQKATTLDCPSGAPWWANAQASAPRIRESLITTGAGDANQIEFKRIRDERFLVRCSDQKYQLTTPKTAIQLRNRIPAPRLHRDFDSRAAASSAVRAKSELFSQEVLVEGQRFVAEIHCDNNEILVALAGLVGVLKHWKHWLRLGRGGSPVEIVSHCELVTSATAATECAAATGTPRIAVYLVSDMILRGPDLGFYPSMTPEVLLELGIISGTTAANLKLVKDDSVVSTTNVSGFVSSIGKRRRSEIAIKRGSVFCFVGSEQAINELRAALLGMQHRGLGMRTDEGYGQFLVDPFSESAEFTLEALAGALSSKDVSSSPRELACADAIEFVEQVLSKRSGAWPARGQWQALLRRVKSLTPGDSLESIFADLSTRAATNSGSCWRTNCGDPAAPLHEQLSDRSSSLKTKLRAEFVIAVARLVIASMDEPKQPEAT